MEEYVHVYVYVYVRVHLYVLPASNRISFGRRAAVGAAIFLNQGRFNVSAA
jgi:hypothetical protein